MSKKLSEYLSALVLLLCGLASITISILDIFDFFQLFPGTKGVDIAILSVLGIVSFTLGVERLTTFRQIEHDFESVKKLILSTAASRELQGNQEIYAEGARLVQKANYHLRTIVFSTGPKAPDSFVSAVIKRMKEVKEQGHYLQYEVILAFNLETLPKDFWAKNDKRINDYYKKAGVRDQLAIYLLDVKHPIGLDVLIVDEQHVTLGFPTVEKISSLQSGLSFENQPELAKKFSGWYDQVLLRSAVPYEAFALNNKK